MKKALYFLLLSMVLLVGSAARSWHVQAATGSAFLSFDHSYRPSYTSTHCPDYFIFTPGVEASSSSLLYDISINENDDNDFAAGKYLLPSVVDFHFVKYFENEAKFSNRYLLLFRMPVTCIYLQQQDFRI
jgi:hypothetical protein